MACCSRIPVVRSIYSSVKKVSDTLFSENGNAFRKAVLVQWPRAGVWTIAFRPVRRVARWPITSGDYVSVYVPTTPNPTGGYFVMLPPGGLHRVRMSVDDALTTSSRWVWWCPRRLSFSYTPPNS